ncbi:MAG: TIGR03915 family putative DNA repair protein [Oscillospiraceae bacterium]|nr:TIGR03915 family putative DNA repair protein [Oscillospiraceae bacterium]
MNIFLFDGSIGGFLTCVYEYYYSNIKVFDILREDRYTPNFCDTYLFIDSDINKYGKVRNAIKKKIGPNLIEEIYYCNLSDLNCHMDLLRYVDFAFKHGVNYHLYKQNELVIKIDKIIHKVLHEFSRFAGFARFNRLTNDVLYSKIEPDHNILPLLYNHFKDRLLGEKWIIHDLKREIAIMCYEDEIEYISLSRDYSAKILENSDDSFIELLWRTYFKSITIENRINLDLQRKLMPKRYWNNLTEMK